MTSIAQLHAPSAPNGQPPDEPTALPRDARAGEGPSCSAHAQAAFVHSVAPSGLAALDSQKCARVPADSVPLHSSATSGDFSAAAGGSLLEVWARSAPAVGAGRGAPQAPRAQPLRAFPGCSGSTPCPKGLFALGSASTGIDTSRTPSSSAAPGAASPPPQGAPSAPPTQPGSLSSVADADLEIQLRNQQAQKSTNSAAPNANSVKFLTPSSSFVLLLTKTSADASVLVSAAQNSSERVAASLCCGALLLVAGRWCVHCHSVSWTVFSSPTHRQ